MAVKIRRRFILFVLFLVFVFPQLSEAKQYPIFDGQYYNNLYYPRVDIIEWGNPPHLEFHIYSKDEPIEISAQPIQHKGKRVLQVNYFFTKRQEKLCRRVLAPANFSPDSTLYFYKDGSDKEYDNIYVSVIPMKPSQNLVNYPTKGYSDCEETTPSESNRGVASQPPTPATSVLVEQNEGSIMHKRQQPAAGSQPPKQELIDYENNAMPFNF